MSEFRQMMEQREQSQACLDSAESRQSSAFRQMKRKRQQLSNEESIAILEKATAGTLALLGDDDYPYAVPISFVYHEGKLYFHSAMAGHKVDAIRKCDKASFAESVLLRMNRKSWKLPACLATATTRMTMRACKRKSRVAFPVC